MGIALPTPPTAAQEQLLARLSDERTVDALNRLIDRLDVLAFAVEALDGLLRRADTVTESVADSLGDLRKLGEASGAGGIAEQLPKLARAGTKVATVATSPAFERLLASGLIDKLGDPKTIEDVEGLLNRLGLATFILDALDGWLRRGDEFATSMAEATADLRKTMPDFDTQKIAAATKHLPDIIDALDSLPPVVGAGKTLIASGMLDPKVVSVLGDWGRSAVQALDEAKRDQSPPRAMGVFALMKALKDPDVARALDFGLRAAKSFGRTLP